MRLVFAGTPAAALPSLRALLASSHDVVAVLTRPPAPRGRGRHVAPSAVEVAARAAGLEVLTPQRPSDPDFVARLAQLAPDCCPVVAYGGLLRRAALDIPPRGWVNLHFSLLPAWRGAAPVQRALLAGDDVAGATTFRLVRALDAGPTYGSVTEQIQPTDTSGDLLARLAEAGAGLLRATVDGIADGSLQAIPQREEGASSAPKLTVAEAEVPWHAPAAAVDRVVRCCTPAPGAWTLAAGNRLKVGPVTVRPGFDGLLPGALEIGRTHVLVGTASDAVELGEVQPTGKPRMPAAAWARGLRTHLDRLGA